MGTGGAAFGFEVPQGDPGALDSAAGSWRTLALALGEQGDAIATGSQVALGAGSWDGSAAGAFAGSSERLIGAFRSNVEASGNAATALSQLARELEHAQQVTRQALADCERAQADAITQQATANQAGQNAQSAQQAADAAVHPSVAAALAREASDASAQQTAAQGAANRAGDALTAAQTRGQQAMSVYEHQAQTIAGRLRAAAGELRPAPEVGHGWAEPVVTWTGHVNDYAGAGAAGLIKGYDQAIVLAGKQLAQETEQVLGDPEATANVMSGLPVDQFDSNPGSEFELLQGSKSLADSPLTKVLTKGLPEDTFGVLGKVPYLAAGVTALDMFANRNEGTDKAVVEPLVNLGLGTVVAEGASSAIAPAVTSGAMALAGGDGMVAVLAGTALVPGAIEVVAVGAVAVVGTIAIEKGATWVWDHGGAHVAGEAWHGIEHGADWAYNEGKSFVHTASHVVHDIEPWNWSL